MDDYPGLGSYLDRHGTRRWRYRHRGRTVSLPCGPGEPGFDEAYQAAVEGRPIRKAEITVHPHAAAPRSLAAAWRLVRQSAEWQVLDDLTRANTTRVAERFLLSPVIEGEPDLWSDMPVADVKRRHIKKILADRAATPHAAKNLLTLIRKLILAALDEEWIEADPTYRVKWRPAYVGFRAWTADEMAAFEARWAVGSTPRLVYALALWLGNRRSDLVRLRWDQLVERKLLIDGKIETLRGFQIVQKKTGKVLFVPETPMLAEALAATVRRGETVVVTAYGEPFTAKSITGRMADWTHSAGLPKGCTLHGLRKTLGKLLAEGGASTRQLMDVLGHDDMEHAELYSREANQVLLAAAGMERVVTLVGKRKVAR
ncbi:MAG: tyrosine-type recombinase/integrase [Rhizobiales bacterium]|nr:tyrosine-type recombinase/integrase [Hyphomicrobiales bacterium]OJU37143.1 MAG: integrase [Rhizobiales bacterium 68-8]